MVVCRPGCRAGMSVEVDAVVLRRCTIVLDAAPGRIVEANVLPIAERGVGLAQRGRSRSAQGLGEDGRATFARVADARVHKEGRCRNQRGWRRLRRRAGRRTEEHAGHEEGRAARQREVRHVQICTPSTLRGEPGIARDRATLIDSRIRFKNGKLRRIAQILVCSIM